MSYKETYQKWADFKDLPDYLKNELTELTSQNIMNLVS